MHCYQTQHHLSNDQTGPLDPWTRGVGDREAGHREVGDRQVGYRKVGDREVGEVGDLDPGPLKRRANAPFSACACFFSQSPAVSAVPTSRNSMAGKGFEKSSNRNLGIPYGWGEGPQPQQETSNTYKSISILLLYPHRFSKSVDGKFTTITI